MNYDISDLESPIIPIVIGDAQKAVDMSESLYKRGILIPAIRPPTVPVNSSRLRMTVMSLHTKEDLEFLFDVLSEVLTL